MKPKRLFTFGCSFTKYRLNTWANIVAKKMNVKEFYNFGVAGACNMFIGTRFSQALKFYEIDKDDLVMICWTDIDRESSMLNGMWRVKGGRVGNAWNYDNREYTEDDKSFYSQRDAMIIQSTYDTLKYHGIPFEMFSMTNLKKSMTPKIAVLYHDTLSNLKPAMIDVLGEGPYEHGDVHPNLRQHLYYLQKTFGLTSTNEIDEFIDKYKDDTDPPWLRKRDSFDYDWFDDVDNRPSENAEFDKGDN